MPLMVIDELFFVLDAMDASRIVSLGTKRRMRQLAEYIDSVSKSAIRNDAPSIKEKADRFADLLVNHMIRFLDEKRSRSQTLELDFKLITSHLNKIMTDSMLRDIPAAPVFLPQKPPPKPTPDIIWPGIPPIIIQGTIPRRRPKRRKRKGFFEQWGLPIAIGIGAIVLITVLVRK